MLQRVAEAFSNNSFGELFRCNQELQLKSGDLANLMMASVTGAEDDAAPKKKARINGNL